ncbi:MAG: Uma2 family endonuclease [Caldilineaceae bacterium]|nr:Uma2 family endonuclease [Caldilineaceae bacterium]
MTTPALTVEEKQQVLRGKSYREFLLAVEEFPALRVEFMDGEIVMTPAPVPAHQLISGSLYRLLDRYASAQGLGRVLYAPLDVELAPRTRIVQPDLVFIPQERLADLLGEKRITGAPDLVVEILLPATMHADRHVKLPLYAGSGVAEYWIIDPDHHAVEIYILDGESYRVAGIFIAGDRISVGRFADAGMGIDAIFAM